MIVSGLIYLVVSVLTGIVSLLPPISALPTAFNDAMSSFGAVVGGWASVFTPLATIIIIIGWVITFEYYNLLLHFALWVIKKIRG